MKMRSEKKTLIDSSRTSHRAHIAIQFATSTQTSQLWTFFPSSICILIEVKITALTTARLSSQTEKMLSEWWTKSSTWKCLACERHKTESSTRPWADLNSFSLLAFFGTGLSHHHQQQPATLSAQHWITVECMLVTFRYFAVKRTQRICKLRDYSHRRSPQSTQLSLKTIFIFCQATDGWRSLTKKSWNKVRAATEWYFKYIYLWLSDKCSECFCVGRWISAGPIMAERVLVPSIISTQNWKKI